jgi:glycine dehydrogenase subunit 1
MAFVPHSDNERREMLREIGVDRFEALLHGVPESLRLKSPLNIPDALSELETVKHLDELAARNHSAADFINFMGAGAYDHFIPAIVSHLTDRSEFKTAYTPYQAEVSQGTLQGIYEFQSLICRLTGMEVANASMYDGASATAEAVLLALHFTQKRKVVLSPLLHPHYADVINIYLGGEDIEIVRVNHVNGIIDVDDLKPKIKDAACFVMQNPNFYGIVEPTDRVPQVVKSADAMLIAVVNPISLACLKAPGEYEADVCVGEGQPLGNSLSFGGPYFGFFATMRKYVRQLPGRLTAMTSDRAGKRGFCLTLQTREQHIRRDKATSNICTNEALCALAGAIYLSALGKEGLKEVAQLCFNKAHYLQSALCSVKGVKLAYDNPFFMEFALEFPEPSLQVFDKLVAKRIFAGVPTTRFMSKDDYLIVCATEKRTKSDIDFYRDSLEEVMV